MNVNATVRHAMEPPRAILLLALLSAVILAGAYGSQHIGGLTPCDLCLEQRKPHWLVLGLGLAGMILISRGRRSWLPVLLLAMAATFAVGGGIAGFHVGVEQHWWQGPTTCSAALPSAGGLDDLLAALKARAVVSCDQVAWSLAGISMAGYNFLISTAAALFAVAAAARSMRNARPA